MDITENSIITVEATVNAPVEKVWKVWTDPRLIIKWNAASPDWHSPYAENDLRVGGKFLSRMEAKDGSFGFDFNGIYTAVEQYKRIEYTMEDGRKVNILFSGNGRETKVTESFEAESTHPLEMQKTGWQAILDNFKNHAEAFDESLLLHFETAIQASPEKVYKTMLEENTYKEWTSEFSPSSHFKGSWEKGAKILFIGTDQDGNKGGMVSRIRENMANKFLSIEHLGILQGDTEITSGPEVETWAGALENYTFTKDGDKTILSVDMDVNDEFRAYFQETWPKALNRLKALCEK